MDQHIQRLFNQVIVAQAIVRYGISVEDVSLIGGFESYVYEFARDGCAYVLRFTHDSHRTANEIRGEAEWINYLADRGIPAARAVLSAHEQLVEVIPADEGAFIVTAFEKAPGTYPGQEDLGPVLFRKMGTLVGRMHTLTQMYTPSRPAYRRHQWYEDSEAFAKTMQGHVPSMLSKKFAAIMDRLRTLPTPHDAYGLVHIDVHRGNFYLDGDCLTLFDFDDCQYSWFVDDIAMALFYAVPVAEDNPERIAAARMFLAHFLPAYCSETYLDPVWFMHVPTFLKAREVAVCMALWAHTGGDLEQLQGWSRAFMDERLARILNDMPYLDLDFVSIARAYVGD